MGDREQVEDAVGRAAGCGDRGDGVLDRRAAQDRGRPHVATHEVHDELAAGACGVVLGRVLGRDAVHAGRAQAEELGDRAHRVGRELATAGARPGTRGVLDLGQLVQADPPGPIGSDRLEDRDHRRAALAVDGSGIDRAAIEDQRWQVEPPEGHDRAGRRLVAAGDADQAIEQVATRHELDRIGDDLAADEARLHALGAHRHAVRDRDRVELHRRAPGRPDAGLHLLGQPPVVVVAGHGLDPGVGDADDRSTKVVVGESDRLQHSPGRGTIRALGQGRGVTLRGVDRAIVRVGHRADVLG